MQGSRRTLLSYTGVALALVHDVNVKQSGMPLGAVRFTAYAMTVASAASLLQFAFIHPESALALSARVYELSFAMAMISTVLPTFLIASSMRRIGSSHTALVGSFGPIATIYLAYVFLGEAVSVLQIGGSVLVIAGMLTISVSNKRKDGGRE